MWLVRLRGGTLHSTMLDSIGCTRGSSFLSLIFGSRPWTLYLPLSSSPFFPWTARVHQVRLLSMFDAVHLFLGQWQRIFDSHRYGSSKLAIQYCFFSLCRISVFGCNTMSYCLNAVEKNLISLYELLRKWGVERVSRILDFPWNIVELSVSFRALREGGVTFIIRRTSLFERHSWSTAQ